MKRKPLDARTLRAVASWHDKQRLVRRAEAADYAATGNLLAQERCCIEANVHVMLTYHFRNMAKQARRIEKGSK